VRQRISEFSNAPCTADSDSNIKLADPADAHYIGKHPGTAFLEVQFIPAGLHQPSVGSPVTRASGVARWRSSA
jgi:hypothetical protein